MLTSALFVNISNISVLLLNDYCIVRSTWLCERLALLRWLQLRFDFDSTAVRRTFECLWKVITFAVMWPASRSHADLFISPSRSAADQS